MDITSVLDQTRQRAFPELSPTTAARVDDMLTRLGALDCADGAIAGRQLVRVTRKGDLPTRKLLRRCMALLANLGAA